MGASQESGSAGVVHCSTHPFRLASCAFRSSYSLSMAHAHRWHADSQACSSLHISMNDHTRSREVAQLDQDFQLSVPLVNALSVSHQPTESLAGTHLRLPPPRHRQSAALPTSQGSLGSLDVDPTTDMKPVGACLVILFNSHASITFRDRYRPKTAVLNHHPTPAVQPCEL
ncbi:hypothetical protein CBOM_07518 [Ceraceosorus bombacis]|uniref:Uncharacterized protein n=1 Tax=Ceraceosorus bombacis TaxID=401625 RepID=A0A0P1BE49_9BASI|nr:hypothetical protein CBOM_07518 [Ceraceosorus bombacis]